MSDFTFWVNVSTIVISVLAMILSLYTMYLASFIK